MHIRGPPVPLELHVLTRPVGDKSGNNPSRTSCSAESIRRTRASENSCIGRPLSACRWFSILCSPIGHGRLVVANRISCDNSFALGQ